VKPAPFELVRPTSLADALEVLAANPDAKVLAGGQSLIPLLSMRLAAPALLVDINGIAELAYVRAEADGVRVGALARHAEVEADPDARRVQPLLAQALRLVAHPTIRNRGTTVGSIVHADPSAEMPVVLSLLDGRVTVAAATGRREIRAAELFRGPMESTLRPDEIAVEAFFPALADDAGVAVEEVSRRHGDYALCGVAALVQLADSALTARAGFLSVCEVPTVVDLTPALAAGVTGESLEAAVELALAALDPEEDIHATAAYRRHLVSTLTKRVVTAAHADAVSRSDEGRRGS
jgi:carbon-monoxide dehydrogenase medium subunit